VPTASGAQPQREARAALPVVAVGGQQLATVALDQAAADPQAQPGAVLLAGDEGLEQLAQQLGRARAGVVISISIAPDAGVARQRAGCRRRAWRGWR
jgi:hypothetical protein